MLQIYTNFSPPSKNFFCNPQKFSVPLPLHRRSVFQPAGNYILKGVTCALFLKIQNLGTFETQTKQMQKGRHGLCIYIPVVCQGYIIPFRTLYGCIYATKRGVILSVLCVGFPKTLNFGRTEVKAPRFFYVSLTRLNKLSVIRLLGRGKGRRLFRLETI